MLRGTFSPPEPAGTEPPDALLQRIFDSVLAAYDTFVITPGDLYLIEPGHTGWLIGEEPGAGIEFAGVEEFGKAPTA